MKKRTKCVACGSKAVVERGDFPFPESGLSTLVLRGVDVEKCPQCGDSPVIPQPAKLLREVTRALIAKPARLKGEEVRFLRKRVGRSAKEFAEMLHFTPYTLSRVENGKQQLGMNADLLVRLAVDRLMRDESDPLLLRTFPAVEDRVEDLPIMVDAQAVKAEYPSVAA